MPGPLMLLLLLLNAQIIASNSILEGWKYEVVYPRKLHTQHKRETKSKYPDQVHYELEVNGKPIVLQLERTEDLLFSNYTETQYLDDGTPVTTIPEEMDHCYYQGQAKEDSSSMVSLSVCQGLSGIIITQEQKLSIEPLNLTENGAHAVYAYQDQDAPKTCGVDHTMYNESAMIKTSSSRRSSEVEEFLKARKYIELYIVADHSMFIKYDRNEEEIRTRVFKMINYINTVYKALNIFVALTGMEIWKTNDQFEVVTNIHDTLNRFSAWRKNNLLPRKPHDNAQFLTNIVFNKGDVGLASVEAMCDDSWSAGVNQECTNNCCDATTCKLKQGAQCAEGECCQDCQLKTAGSVCRPAKHECDLSDMCDGKSPMCPSDRFQANGVPCLKGEGYCYNGKCPTLNGQCKRYWGPESVVADDSCCNTMNPKSCKVSGADCTSRDVKCGVLFCSRGLSKPIVNYGYCTWSPDCKTLSPAVLVEDGTRCGNNSMCSKRRCITVPDVQTCSAQCPGHGVCDHEQQCQCEEGWVPPNCDSRAQFGSGYVALIVIIVIFLLIFVVSVLFIVYKKRSQWRIPGYAWH